MNSIESLIMPFPSSNSGAIWCQAEDRLSIKPSRPLINWGSLKLTLEDDGDSIGQTDDHYGESVQNECLDHGSGLIYAPALH